MNRVLIAGPVCAGKTTLAAKLAAESGIFPYVLDFDTIAEQLGSPRTHDHDTEWRAAAETEYQRQLATHTGPMIAIRSAAKPASRMAIARKMRAHQILVLITPPEICEQRARDNGRSDDAIASIRQWFADFKLTRRDRIITQDGHQ